MIDGWVGKFLIWIAETQNSAGVGEEKNYFSMDKGSWLMG